MENKTNKLSRFIATIEKSDKKLSGELKELRKSSEVLERAKLTSSLLNDEEESVFEGFNDDASLETIVLQVGRPVLTVFDGDPQLAFTDTESQVWRERLTASRDQLITTIKSVGRIELKNHPVFNWVGTGWLVADNIVVTNRHVAEIFGKQKGATFTFRQGIQGKDMGASIDLLEEAGNVNEFAFIIKEILYIEPEPGPDLAFLFVDQASNTKPVPLPISLTGAKINDTPYVGVIGYPAKDSRIPDQQLMERIFGDVYEKKKLAPGMITQVTEDRLFHDCSTLGGCSGGAVIDLKSGNAVGLHFAGRFLESNFAVPSSLIIQRLNQIKKPNVRAHSITPDSFREKSNGTHPVAGSIPSSGQVISSSGTYSFSIPMNISISFDKPGDSAAVVPISVNVMQPKAISGQDQHASEEDDDFLVEGKPEDYKDRVGYDPEFLGEGFSVPLPEVINERKKKEIVTYDLNGNEEYILRYEHYSVVMNRSRRMCFFSAVNINGRTTKKFPRTGWRLDPRIPRELQIMKECYGNPPKFSRGHMTRREDPVWGTEESAMRGNADSMCVTNVTPQMQSFNAPIWLALEDYALNHARDDKMRISVFTGPVMRSNDVVLYGVKIPQLFWKVIAFIHDETGKLSATGYKMSQRDQLPEEEFVFGKFQTAQTSLASIERLTGLSFGSLTGFDPMSVSNEAIPAGPLVDVDQIRFF